MLSYICCELAHLIVASAVPLQLVFFCHQLCISSKIFPGTIISSAVLHWIASSVRASVSHMDKDRPNLMTITTVWTFEPTHVTVITPEIMQITHLLFSERVCVTLLRFAGRNAFLDSSTSFQSQSHLLLQMR